VKEETKEALFILSAIASIIGVTIVATKALKDARADSRSRTGPTGPGFGPGTFQDTPVVRDKQPGGGVVTTQPTISFLSDPVKLTQGSVYRARLGLGPIEMMVATSDLIAKQFEALGFRNVKVFGNVSELPGDWPRETMVAATVSSRWIEGVWSLPSAAIAKPPQIQLAWLARESVS
jgi:hypothetical protein